MYLGLYINEFIFSFSNFTKSLEIFTPLLIVILIAGFFLNKILSLLYYIFIEVKSNKNMNLKPCKVMRERCSGNNIKSLKVKKSAATK